jgi:hypothetical protein
MSPERGENGLSWLITKPERFATDVKVRSTRKLKTGTKAWAARQFPSPVSYRVGRL